MVTDPEAPEVRRALTGDTRELYVASYAAWRDRIAHDFTEAGLGYFAGIVGDETPDHLIRRIAAPRGVAATA
jgi:hypothetical protein